MMETGFPAQTKTPGLSQIRREEQMVKKNSFASRSVIS